MKKNFSLTAPNKKPDRQVEWVKHEINKYLGRERRKTLPEGVDYWDFDCKFGADESSAAVIHVSEIGKKIDGIVLENRPSFYIEILAKQAKRLKRDAVSVDNESEDGESDNEQSED
ncbi:MAG: hypothetical protein H7256_05390 [Bdellovibrio sp.]|nr:hypothetical protein [Bdellovibrio sp.]